MRGTNMVNSQSYNSKSQKKNMSLYWATVYVQNEFVHNPVLMSSSLPLGGRIQ